MKAMKETLVKIILDKSNQPCYAVSRISYILLFLIRYNSSRAGQVSRPSTRTTNYKRFERHHLEVSGESSILVSDKESDSAVTNGKIDKI